MDIDLQILGDAIANLTLLEAMELSRYLDETDGTHPVGVLAPLEPQPQGDLAYAGQ